ncbi:response regulator [Patulibacter sp. SYSU D01012]|uniref:response regulator n=1 Tax=Patulibacter sp. SYSU D01012 TaxID=2817381 RepID=UPI001B30DB05
MRQGAAASALAGRRVLVVDDTPELAEIVTFVLERAGADVTTVFDGDAAVRHATREGCDLVVLDVGLPGIDGFEACRRIVAERDTCVVMLSARVTDADRERGRVAGAAGYLIKPFTPRGLVADLETIIEARDDDHGRG